MARCTGTYARTRLNREEVESDVGAYGLWLVGEMLRRRGATVLDWPTAEPCTILASLYWAEQLYELAALRAEVGPRQRIVVGGVNAWVNPGITLCFSDAVFVGDGEAWDGATSGPHILTARPVEPMAPVVEPVRPLCFQAETKLGTTAFVELSRGCPRRCFFCQYSWVRPWRAASQTDAMAALELLTAKKVAPRTADRGRIPWYGAWGQAAERRGAQILGGETSIARILEDPGALASLRRVRVGIDGLSERLRASVGKPTSTEQIIEAITLARRAGIGQFMLYVIWGLPGETDDDVREFDALLDQLATGPLYGRGSVIGWNAFQPNALTPMQWCASAIDRDTTAMRDVIARRRAGATFLHQPKLQSPERQLRRMVAMRATPGCAPIVRAFVRRPSVGRNVGMVRREFERVAGVDPCGPWPANKPLPWDGWIAHDRGKLESIARKRGWLS